MAKHQAGDYVVVLVTCASAGEARRIARSVVTRRLAACVNVLPTPVESIYRWKGKVETAREVLLVIKSSRKRMAALRAEVQRLHSYEVPEIIALPIVAGSPAYLAWLADCLVDEVD
jgi:periplasmic divalent cation tolerance protein